MFGVFLARAAQNSKGFFIRFTEYSETRMSAYKHAFIHRSPSVVNCDSVDRCDEVCYFDHICVLFNFVLPRCFVFFFILSSFAAYSVYVCACAPV